MLPSQRKRLQENQILDQRGVPWSSEISDRAKIQIATYWDILVRKLDGYRESEEVWHGIGILLRLVGGHNTPSNFYSNSLLNEKSQDIVLDAISGFSTVIDKFLPDNDYQEFINKTFNLHRISYKFIDGTLTPFQDDYLFKNVIEPATGLLISNKYNNVKSAYLDALEEISNNKPGDAITDAGTALQELLQALDCKGKTLGDLIKSAKNNGLFGPQDSPLLNSVEGALRWVASERNQIGDTHGVSKANIADAWMIIHIVGAIIVRLSDKTLRSVL